MLAIYPKVDFDETCPADGDNLKFKSTVIPGM